jgi:hypothetical protein
MTDRMNELDGEITQKREMNPASLANQRPFPPGNRANPGGRPRTKLFRRRILKHLRHPDGEVERIDRVVANIIDAASQPGKDRVAAFEALRDSTDGRPRSDEGTDNAPIIVNIVSLGAATDEDEK